MSRPQKTSCILFHGLVDATYLATQLDGPWGNGKVTTSMTTCICSTPTYTKRWPTKKCEIRFHPTLQTMNSGSTTLALKEAALHLIVFPETSPFSNWNKGSFSALLCPSDNQYFNKYLLGSNIISLAQHTLSVKINDTGSENIIK